MIANIEKDRMEYLVNQLNYYTDLYDKGTPVISDKEWDDLYFELVDLETRAGYHFKESPTQSIRYEVKSKLDKVEHNHAMLSLDKTKDWHEFINHFESTKDVTGMLKLDGLTVCLTYRGGRLVGAETRGDGAVGEDILHNARVIPSIPKSIAYRDELIIDGEVICKTSDFEKFSGEYKNPRNFASGSLRLLDSNECAKRKLTFVAWNVVKGFKEENNFFKRLNLIKDLGFKTVPCTSSFDWDAKEFLLKTADELGYPIDGLVGRYTDIAYGESLGSTAHHTNAAYAFKLYDEEYETRLKTIRWQVGRTGVLTPVAVFEPIEIDGTTVEKASLHNYSVMKEIMGDCCYCGQKIKIIKANQIIPQVSWAHKMNYGEVISRGGITCDGFSNDFGLLCPACEGVTHIEVSESGVENVVCGNPQCEGKLVERLEHYCDRKKGMDIHGLSEQTLERLVEWGWVSSIRDIYSLDTFSREWKNKPGFGEKSVDNILTAIENSKQTTLEQFIAALGIPLVGRRVAKEIVQYYPTYDDFREACCGEWSALDGFGPEMEKAINSFDYTEADEIAAMLTFKQPEVQVNDTQTDAAAGLVFVITGKLSRPRAEIVSDIEAAGGKVGSSVTSKTNYLVCNQTENTTKYNKAQSLGLPIITETELMEIIK